MITIKFFEDIYLPAFNEASTTGQELKPQKMEMNMDMMDTNIDMIDNMNCHYESYYNKISINELFDSES